MAQCTVTKVALGITKTFKNGKSFEGAELSFISDKGAQKKEFIFNNAPYMTVIKTLGAGDKIEASYTKNGDFFNLTNVSLIEKGTGVAPTPTFGTAKPSGGGYQEPPEKQISIQRQNALNNAVLFVQFLVHTESYKKKTAPNILTDEVLRIAGLFADFNAGVKPKEPAADLSAITGDDSDPFDTGNDDLDI